MAENIKLGFYRGNERPNDAQVGSVFFNTETRVIEIRTSQEATGWESYSGLQDASFSDGKLNLKKADGTNLEVNLGALATNDALNAVIEIVNQHTQVINALDSNYLKIADEKVKSVDTTEDNGVKLTHADGKLGLEVTPGEVKSGNDKVVTGGAVADAIAVAVEGVEAELKTFSIAKGTDAEVQALGANVKEAYKLVDEDNAQQGEWIKIYKDSSIVSIQLSNVNEKGEAGEYLKYTYRNANGVEESVYINISNYLNEAEFKNGLQVNDKGEVSVKIDTASEFISVSEAGIKVTGITEAIQAAVNAIPDLQAEGDDYVSASAEGGKVTVAATKKTQDAVALAETALQKADITTGGANGTIAVEGTDVAVKGLGSAAFTESTAYDAAGSAAAAQQAAQEHTEGYTYSKEQIDNKVGAVLVWNRF